MLQNIYYTSVQPGRKIKLLLQVVLAVTHWNADTLSTLVSTLQVIKLC